MLTPHNDLTLMKIQLSHKFSACHTYFCLDSAHGSTPACTAGDSNFKFQSRGELPSKNNIIYNHFHYNLVVMMVMVGVIIFRTKNRLKRGFLFFLFFTFPGFTFSFLG